MFQTPDRSARRPGGSSPPVRRAPAGRLPARPLAGRPQAGGRDSPGLGPRVWILAGAAVLALLLLWKVVPALVGGEDGNSATSRPTGANGPNGSVHADPAPQGSLSATFPASVEGSRIRFRVNGLGSQPSRCTAEGLRIGEDQRIVFHHRCDGEEGMDRYYLLVRLTNLTNALVSVQLSGFSLTTAQGDVYGSLPTPPVGSPSARFFPPTAELVVDGSLKRWITFDGSDGLTPAKLTYQDGAESLTVRFEGDWT